MRRRVAAAVALVISLLTVAQTDDAMPYPEYRAGIAAFAEAESARQQSAGNLTTVKDIARMEETPARQEAEGDRLAAVTPEPCYADAHAEFLAFWRYRIATYRDTLPLVEGAESVIGMIPMFLAVGGDQGRPSPGVRGRRPGDGRLP